MSEASMHSWIAFFCEGNQKQNSCKAGIIIHLYDP